MDAPLDKLLLYMQYPFVIRAIIVGTLVALCSSLLGVTLVLRRFSFLGDGLAHVAFGALAVAAVLGVSNRMTVILPLTILAAVFLLTAGQDAKIRGDAAVAMISVGALAFGYLLMHAFGTSANLSADVCGALFGSTSILTLSREEVWLCVVLSVLVLALYVFFYHKLFAVTFDEGFARAAGTNVERYNLMIALVIAVIIVLAMNLVGSLLISAFMVFPALSAMRLFRSFRAVVVASAVISVLAALAGLLASVLTGAPVGATIVATDVAAFFLCCLAARITAA
ncbi:MAG: metal ABC transporter permease [Oscillospiraceae bacterium]|nr:metal ABC transporter permease [Oscillospiraceae bacterium]